MRLSFWESITRRRFRGTLPPDVRQRLAALSVRARQRAREDRSITAGLLSLARFVAAIAKDFLRQQAALDDRPIVGAVVHHDFDRLPRIWPRARYIHMLRDPRDVSRSCVQMGWAGNAWAATSVWSAAFGAWRRLRSRVPAEQMLEVRYEALVADTEAELSRICRFLGTEYDPAMLEIERDTTYRRPSPTEASSWRERAPAEEIRQMEARLDAELAEAGYVPSGLPPL